MIVSFEMIDEIRHAIEALPPKCKEIFLLVRIEGYSNQEVALILGISVNTVRTQVSIATDKLQKCIGYLIK